MEDPQVQELLHGLQGCWQNVTKQHEFYMVWDNSVTRIRQNTGETLEFFSILKPDATGIGLQWGVQGRFVLKVDSFALNKDLTEVSWLTPEEANTQALSGPREPGENGVRGWKWKRVDPVLVGLGDFWNWSGPQSYGCAAGSAAVGPAAHSPGFSQVMPRQRHGGPSAPNAVPLGGGSGASSNTSRQAVLAELQGLWKNYLNDGESYLVRGVEVIRVKAGMDAKPFRLYWDDATGRLWWGSTGRYSLQPPTESPLQTAVWESCDGSGRGFCWERSSPATTPSATASSGTQE